MTRRRDRVHIQRIMMKGSLKKWKEDNERNPHLIFQNHDNEATLFFSFVPNIEDRLWVLLWTLLWAPLWSDSIRIAGWTRKNGFTSMRFFVRQSISLFAFWVGSPLICLAVSLWVSIFAFSLSCSLSLCLVSIRFWLYLLVHSDDGNVSFAWWTIDAI